MAPWWQAHGERLLAECPGDGGGDGDGGAVSEGGTASMSMSMSTSTSTSTSTGVVCASDLGFAVWVRVLRCVPLRSLGKCSRVSREWRRAARESLAGRAALDFSGTIAGDAVIRVAVDAAAQGACLVHLDLWGTRPSTRGLLALARQGRFARLESLSLWGTCLGCDEESGDSPGGGGGPGMVEVLGRILEDRPRGLRALNLGGTAADDGCLALLHGPRSADLESLLLSGTRVTDGGVRALAAGADPGCNLAQLSLWGCRGVSGKADPALYARWPALSLIGGQI